MVQQVVTTMYQQQRQGLAIRKFPFQAINAMDCIGCLERNSACGPKWDLTLTPLLLQVHCFCLLHGCHRPQLPDGSPRMGTSQNQYVKAPHTSHLNFGVYFSKRQNLKVIVPTAPSGSLLMCVHSSQLLRLIHCRLLSTAFAYQPPFADIQSY